MGTGTGDPKSIHGLPMSITTNDKKDILDTLFVEVSNPPFPVKLDDLLLNGGLYTAPLIPVDRLSYV